MTEQMKEKAEWKFTDGDPDLLSAAAELQRLKEAGQDIPDNQIEHINALLESDVNHRIRIQADYEKAGAISDQVTLMGTVVEVTDKDSGTLGSTQLPFGLLKSSLDLIDETNLLIQDHVSEVTGDNGLSKQVTDFLAPLYQRLLLADAALLELRKFYTLNMNHMAPRTTGYLAEIVAKAEVVTNGAFGSFVAAMNGYGKENWNYGIVPRIAGTESRKLKLYANGMEVFVRAWNYMQVENQPQPDGRMGVFAYLDSNLLQLITTECQIVPVYSVSCWREVTEEEAALDVWARVDDVYVKTLEAYEMVLNQTTKAAEQKKGPQLVLPDHVKQDGDVNLILPQ